MLQGNKTSPRSPNGVYPALSKWDTAGSRKSGVYPAPARRGWVYLFTGEDGFRKELSLDRLKTRVLDEKPDPFNYELYNGKENRAEEIIRSLDTLPLTASRKLVVLKDPELLPEEDRARLSRYLRRSQKNKAVFVLLSQTLPIPGDEFSATLSKYARVINFTRLKPDEISSWIIKEFKDRNKIIRRQTAELIREVTQQDLGQAFSLIEQISIYTGTRERITDDDVLSFSETPTESFTFKLLDYINGRDTARSLRILEGLLRGDNSPSQILGLLGWHITRLIAIKRLLIKKIPKSKMTSSLNIGSYTLNRLISQAENFTLGQLKDHLNALLDTDLMLKRSNIKGQLLLEMLIVKLGGQSG